MKLREQYVLQQNQLEIQLLLTDETVQKEVQEKEEISNQLMAKEKSVQQETRAKRLLKKEVLRLRKENQLLEEETRVHCLHAKELNADRLDLKNKLGKAREAQLILLEERDAEQKRRNATATMLQEVGTCRNGECVVVNVIPNAATNTPLLQNIVHGGEDEGVVLHTDECKVCALM